MENRSKLSQNALRRYPGGVLGGFWGFLARMDNLLARQSAQERPVTFKIIQKIIVERVLGASWCL